MVTNLHHLAVSNLLGHERTGSTGRAGTFNFRGNACTVEFCIFVWAYWTDLGFRRNSRSTIAGPGDASLFLGDYRNFLAFHLHRNPWLYSATFCQMSYWTAVGMGTAAALYCRLCPSPCQLCPSQFYSPVLAFAGLMISSRFPLFLLSVEVEAEAAQPLAFFLFYFV